MGAMESGLVASGRFARIETRGRRTGEPRAVTVGYVEDDADPPRTIRVAAGAPETAWGRNLLVQLPAIAERLLSQNLIASDG